VSSGDIALPADIVIVSAMRRTGGCGLQTHARDFNAFLESIGRRSTLVTPFCSKSPLLYPVFAARRPIGLLSGAASVWWYRHWHASFLRHALRPHLTGGQAPLIVYAQCPVSAAVALRLRDRAPVVMVAHFNISQGDEWVGKGLVRRDGVLYRSIRAFEEETLPQLDGIVYVSDFSRREIEHRIPAARAVRSVVTHNWVKPVARPWVKPIADLVTVGSLEPRKNQAYLLEILAIAARRGRRYTLSVIGDGQDRDRLERLTRKLDLAGQVRFVGHHPDPRSLMSKHRLYCHTSTMESFGITLLEAMAEGLPVITGRVGGIPEFVRPGQVGEFWPLDDAGAAADILISLMDDRDSLAAMGARGAANAAEFAPEVQGAKTLSFLDTYQRAGR